MRIGIIVALCGMIVWAAWRLTSEPAPVAPPPPPPEAAAADAAPAKNTPSKQLPTSWTWQDYTFKEERDKNSPLGKFIVMKGDAVLLEIEESRMAPYHRDNAFWDVTGDNQPELVFKTFTGGAHCCVTLYIYSLAPEFKQLGEFGGHSYPPELRDLDGDGVMEVVDHDSYAYIWTPFVNSPAPEVILSLKGDHYDVAPMLMLKPPLSDEEFLRTKVEIITGSVTLESGVSPEDYTGSKEVFYGRLLKPVLNLIYSGNAGQAKALIHTTWPDGMGNKYEFLSQLSDAVKRHEYGSQLLQLSEEQIVP